jgi:hypothetical protein
VSTPDPNIERAMVEADEAHTARVVRRVTGIGPQPDPSGLLGSEPVAASASGEIDEEALYQQHMRRFFPRSVE